MSFENSKQQLFDALIYLEKLVTNAERRLKPFQEVTIACVNGILRYGLPHINRYLRRWMCSFIGNKDECMVLISGEVIRNYHQSEHRSYQQVDRGKETDYYKKSSFLSFCSTDGLDYEYRVLSNKYKNKSSLDRIADASESLSERLHRLSQSINDASTSIKKAVQSFNPTYLNLVVEHCAEIIEVHFSNPEMKLIIQGKKFRNISRAEALSTTVEDPLDVPTNNSSNTFAVNNSGKRISNCLNETEGKSTDHSSAISRKPKRRLDIESDEEPEMEATNSSKQAEVPDFQMSVSLDEIKRAYGASDELVANPLHKSVEEELDDDGVLVESETAHPVETEAKVEYCRDILWRKDLPAVLRRNFKFKVLNPNPHSSGDSSLSEFIYISMELCSYEAILETKEKAKYQSKILFSASDVLDEVARCLWMGFTPRFSSEGLLKGYSSSAERIYPWIPRYLQLDGVKYTYGSMIPVPAADKMKKFPILCEGSDFVSSLLKQVKEWIFFAGNHNKEELSHRQEIAVRNLSLIRRVIQAQRKKEQTISLCLIESYEINEDWGNVSRSELSEVILRRVILSSLIGTEVCRCSCSFLATACPADLWMLFQVFESVNLTDCYFQIKEIVSAFDIFKSSFDNESQISFKVQEIQLQFNSFLHYANMSSFNTFPSSFETVLSPGLAKGIKEGISSSNDVFNSIVLLVEAVKAKTIKLTDPWSLFCQVLFSNAHELRLVNLSYCVSSFSQAFLLVLGIVHGVQFRPHSNTDSQLKLLIHGLLDLFPEIDEALRKLVSQLYPNCTIAIEASFKALPSISF